MRLRDLFYFLTLVLVFSLLTQPSMAAPNTNIPPSGIDTRPIPKKETSENTKSLNESVNISEPPPARDSYRSNKVWTPSPRSNSIGAGYGTGIYDKDKEAKNTLLVSLMHTDYQGLNRAREYGLEITDIKFVGVNYGYKFLCCDYEYYEPFYKVALAAYYDPKDFLANLINFDRYLIRGSVGFENLFYLKRRLKIELAAGVGPLGLTTGAHLFYTLPW